MTTADHQPARRRIQPDLAVADRRGGGRLTVDTSVAPDLQPATRSDRPRLSAVTGHDEGRTAERGSITAHLPSRD